MGKSWTIKYEVAGSKRIDFIIFYAASAKKAMDMFLEHEFEINGIKFTYNEYSIVSIH